MYCMFTPRLLGVDTPHLHPMNITCRLKFIFDIYNFEFLEFKKYDLILFLVFKWDLGREVRINFEVKIGHLNC